MPRVLVNDTYLYSIGNALRSRLNVSRTFKPSEMGDAVSSIPSPGAVGLSMSVGRMNVIRIQEYDIGSIGKPKIPVVSIVRVGKEIE